MSSPTGAHGEADATKQENEQQPQSTASTDATLNARAKSSSGAKSQGPKKWLIALIAVIAAVAVIVAIAVTRGKNDDANISGVTKADTVTIGLKLAPVSLDIRHQSGSAIEQVLIGNVYESAAVARLRQQSAAGSREILGHFQGRQNLHVPSQQQHVFLQWRQT